MIACVDLFCGLGGLTCGLARGGIRVVAGVDIDAECRFPFERNNTARFIQKDIRELSAGEVRSLWPDRSVTLLAGCAPCQPFSTYSRGGRRADDSKWETVSEFGRLVRQASPDLVTLENVPQLRDHLVFDEFVGSLRGYEVWYGVVPCERYGVPQTRKRLILLASRLGPVSLDPPAGPPATVRGAIGHLPPVAAGGRDTEDALHTASRLSRLNARRIRASRPGGTWRDWPPALVAECHRKPSGGTYPSVYGRMAWDAPAPTITTQCFGYGNGRFGHPEQDRAITLREAAILQTFPGSYQFLPPGAAVRFNVLGRLIGNAVPVRLGEVIAQSLLRHVRSASGEGGNGSE